MKETRPGGDAGGEDENVRDGWSIKKEEKKKRRKDVHLGQDDDGSLNDVE